MKVLFLHTPVQQKIHQHFLKVLFNLDFSSFKLDLLNQNFLLPCALAALCQLSGTAFLILLFRLRNFAIGSTYVRTEVLIAAASPEGRMGCGYMLVRWSGPA